MTQCKQCTVGQYSATPGQVHCNVCPTDQYNDEIGQLFCKSCRKGLGTISSPDPDDHDNITDCTLKCVSNQYENTTTQCVNCEPGYTCDGKTSAECDAGGYCNNGRRTLCEPGTSGETLGAKSKTEGCSPCTPGRYQIARGQTSCTKCEVGRFSSKTNQVASDACLPCEQPGYYCPEGTSNATDFPCEKGTYSNESQATSCKICTQGLYQPVEGQVSCKGCPAGMFLADQGASPVNHDELGDCQVCPSNTYNDELGKASCKGCPEDTVIQDSTDASKHLQEGDCTLACSVDKYFVETENKCQECEAGYTCDGTSRTPCAAGYWCEGGTHKKGCPAGSFGEEEKMKSEEEACHNCAVGRYQAVIGQTSCSSTQGNPGNYQ